MADLLPGLITAYVTFLVAIVSPGPANIMIANVAMKEGQVPALASALGVITGSGAWGLITSFGLSALLIQMPSLLAAIKVGGGLYLLWLSYKVLKGLFATAAPNGAYGPVARSFLACFSAGLALHLTNPKAPLAWIAIISLAMGGSVAPLTGVVVVVGTTIIATLFYGGIAVLFSTEPFVHRYLRFQKWIDAVTGSVFGLAGLSLLFSGS